MLLYESTPEVLKQKKLFTISKATLNPQELLKRNFWLLTCREVN